MSMSKKDFITLADSIKTHNDERNVGEGKFTMSQINLLARFCQSQNPNFNRERWLDYIAGKCGPSGGKL